MTMTLGIDDIQSMKVAALKQELRDRNLPVGGVKRVLQERLFEALLMEGNQQEEEQPQAPSENEEEEKQQDATESNAQEGDEEAFFDAEEEVAVDGEEPVHKVPGEEQTEEVEANDKVSLEEKEEEQQQPTASSEEVEEDESTYSDAEEEEEEKSESVVDLSNDQSQQKQPSSEKDGQEDESMDSDVEEDEEGENQSVVDLEKVAPVILTEQQQHQVEDEEEKDALLLEKEPSSEEEVEEQDATDYIVGKEDENESPSTLELPVVEPETLKEQSKEANGVVLLENNLEQKTPSEEVVEEHVPTKDNVREENQAVVEEQQVEANEILAEHVPIENNVREENPTVAELEQDKRVPTENNVREENPAVLEKEQVEAHAASGTLSEAINDKEDKASSDDGATTSSTLQELNLTSDNSSKELFIIKMHDDDNKEEASSIDNSKESSDASCSLVLEGKDLKDSSSPPGTETTTAVVSRDDVLLCATVETPFGNSPGDDGANVSLLPSTTKTEESAAFAGAIETSMEDTPEKVGIDSSAFSSTVQDEIAEIAGDGVSGGATETLIQDSSPMVPQEQDEAPVKQPQDDEEKISLIDNGIEKQAKVADSDNDHVAVPYQRKQAARNANDIIAPKGKIKSANIGPRHSDNVGAMKQGCLPVREATMAARKQSANKKGSSIAKQSGIQKPTFSIKAKTTSSKKLPGNKVNKTQGAAAPSVVHKKDTVHSSTTAANKNHNNRQNPVPKPSRASLVPQSNNRPVPKPSRAPLVARSNNRPVHLPGTKKQPLKKNHAGTSTVKPSSISASSHSTSSHASTTQSHHHIHWTKRAPAPKDPQVKDHNRQLFYWCVKCQLWNTAHGTKQHFGPGIGAKTKTFKSKTATTVHN